MKKRMTSEQEFEIMKLVLDKFLWLGFALMVFGLWRMFTVTLLDGIKWMVIGAVVLILFLIIIIKEYEIMR